MRVKLFGGHRIPRLLQGLFARFLKSDGQRRRTFVWRPLEPTTRLWQTLRPRHCYLLRVSTVSIACAHATAACVMQDPLFPACHDEFRVGLTGAGDGFLGSGASGWLS